MRRIYLIALMLSVLDRGQGIFEYWKAGAHTKAREVAAADLPAVECSVRVGSAVRAHRLGRPLGRMPGRPRRRLPADRALRDAVAVPMIGEHYPPARRRLPVHTVRRATRPGRRRAWAMRCAAHARARANFFACPGPGAHRHLVQAR
jgi:hypothetical protein